MRSSMQRVVARVRAFIRWMLGRQEPSPVVLSVAPLVEAPLESPELLSEELTAGAASDINSRLYQSLLTYHGRSSGDLTTLATLYLRDNPGGVTDATARFKDMMDDATNDA